MVELQVRNSFTKIVGNESGLKEHLSYKVAGCEFTKAFQDNKWDGRKSVVVGKLFPTGLLPLAESFLKQNRVEYKLNILYNKLNNKIKKYDYTLGNHPFPYQAEAAKAALKYKRGIIKLPTGTGKSLVAAKITGDLGMVTAVICLTKESMHQFHTYFTECFGADLVGIFSGTKKDIKDITIVSSGSLDNPMLSAFLASSQVIILDEVHSSAAEKYFEYIQRSEAPYRIGLTATPFRNDYKEMLFYGITGSIIYKQDLADAQESERLTRSEVVFIKVPKLEISAKNFLEGIEFDTEHAIDFRQQYDEHIVYNSSRNLLIKAAYMICQEHNLQTIVTVKHREHGELLAEMLDIPFVHGDVNSKERKQRYLDLRDGKLRGAVVTNIYDQSVDIPSLAANIHCVSMANPLRLEQRLGRVLRKHAEKPLSFFIDFGDQFHPKFRSYANRRIKTFKSSGIEQSVRELNIDEFSNYISEKLKNN